MFHRKALAFAEFLAHKRIIYNGIGGLRFQGGIAKAVAAGETEINPSEPCPI